jgi:hypothetical protein
MNTFKAGDKVKYLSIDQIASDWELKLGQLHEAISYTEPFVSVFVPKDHSSGFGFVLSYIDYFRLWKLLWEITNEYI